MQEDPEAIIVEFNNQAAKIYSSVFGKFSDSVQEIKRDEDENVFKLHVARFTLILKDQLEDLVKEIIEASHSTGSHEQLMAALSASIHYYLNEFQLKCNTA